MGRAPCCSKVGLHRGPWTPREDTLLTRYIQAHGEGNWRSLPKKAGLLRCGKSCRLRWMNYLRPDIKRGNISPDEDDLIIRMHALLGNRWSLIAGRLPGRTDNEIKNYWNTHLSKRLRRQGTDPNTHKKLKHPVQQEGKRRKNRDNNNNNQSSTISNKKRNKSKVKVEQKKPETKIHLPKPVRFTSFSSLHRNDSFECNTTVTSMSSSQGGDQLGACLHSAQDHLVENIDIIPWSTDDHGISFDVGDVDHHDDFFNSSDPELCNSLVSTEDDNLEKLYDEYLELLKTDVDQIKLDSLLL